jgi:hypothetical protein
MNKKKQICSLFFFILSFCLTGVLFGQNKSELNRLNNDSLKFSFLIKSSKRSGGLIRNDGYFVTIDFDSIEEEYLKSLKYNEWMKLLQSDSFDWSANLILYCLFEREAMVFTYKTTNRDVWVQRWKNSDIEYWKAFLLDSTNLSMLFTQDSLWDSKDARIRRWDSIHHYFYKLGKTNWEFSTPTPQKQ